MTDIIDSLDQIAHRYDVLFCDLWGCLHNGIRPFPTAVAALQRFRAGGGRVVLLTNAPRPASQITKQLAAMNVPRDCYDFIVTSGESAQEAMLAGMAGQNVWHVGAPYDVEFFSDFAFDLTTGITINRVPLDQAEGIICTGLFDDTTETPQDYRARLLLAKTKGLRLICANPDIVVDRGDTRIYCAGALAQLYTEMGGESLYFGKPHAPIYELARRRLGAHGGRVPPDDAILCIGDGIETDIPGGMAEGLDTLFVTGGLAADQIALHDGRPDAQALRAYLAQHQQSPTAAIGILG